MSISANTSLSRPRAASAFAANTPRASAEQAREIVAASAAEYVLVCPATPETTFYARHAADGVAPEQTLSAVLGAGATPDWLTPVDIGQSPLRLYRVTR